MISWALVEGYPSLQKLLKKKLGFGDAVPVYPELEEAIGQITSLATQEWSLVFHPRPRFLTEEDYESLALLLKKISESKVLILVDDISLKNYLVHLELPNLTITLLTLEYW